MRKLIHKYNIVIIYTIWATVLESNKVFFNFFYKHKQRTFVIEGKKYCSIYSYKNKTQSTQNICSGFFGVDMLITKIYTIFEQFRSYVTHGRHWNRKAKGMISLKYRWWFDLFCVRAFRNVISQFWDR